MDNFADNNTFYTSGKNEQVVVEKIMKDCTRIIDWVKINSLSVHARKFQVVFLVKMIMLRLKSLKQL